MALANVKRETAARMIAEDREPDHRIAAAVGVSLRTIAYWNHCRSSAREMVRKSRRPTGQVHNHLKATLSSADNDFVGKDPNNSNATKNHG